MLVTIVLLLIYALSFVLIYQITKQDKEEGMSVVIVATTLLALIPTAVIALIGFVIFGSTSLINQLFSLEIPTSQLIMLAIGILVYLFTLDSIIEIFIKYIFRKPLLVHLMMGVIRIGLFYIVSGMVGLPDHMSLILAVGVSVIVLLFERLYEIQEKNKEKE
ncbi:MULTISPECIES: hypothetical protein [Gracilibacillus]|uniref:hypothetical protein n=1 Tax=Gracilibacillus TaxID=74385 RepID=UPI000825EBFB|nr:MULTISPECIES: hypothetical protein [Gracilibacillus]